jgi:hypothetical protein
MLGLTGALSTGSGWALPADCIDLLANGDFEAEADGWNQASAGGYELISPFNPRTGMLGAFLAGTNDADDRLSQEVLIPADATTVTLTAWWSLSTQEGSLTADTMVLTIRRPDGAWLADLLTVDNTFEVDLWLDEIVDLTPYRGQEVLLEWHALTDSTRPSSFFLDDLSLVGCGLAFTSPTPSPSPTFTPTATRVTLTSTATSLPPSPTSTSTATATRVTWTPTLTATSVSPLPTSTPTATALRIFLPLVVHH